MERLITVSCDGHVGAPVKDYADYLEPRFRELMPEILEEEQNFLQMQKLFNLNNPGRLEVVDQRGRIASGGFESGWNVEKRLEELDSEGIAAELLYPGTGEAGTPFFYAFNKPYPADIRMAGTRAYHRWLIDRMIKPAKGRLIGTAEPGPCFDIEEAIKEVRFCAKNGFRAAFVPGMVVNPNTPMPPLTDPHFEPLWAAYAELGLVMTIHAGWGLPQGQIIEIVTEAQKAKAAMEGDNPDPQAFGQIVSKLVAMMDAENPDSMFSLGLPPRQVLWHLIFSGVFDRHPALKLTIAECRADWVPRLKERLDARFDAAKKRPGIKRKPSEYFGENIFTSPSSPRRKEVEMRHEIGIKAFMFGADFPHPEGTWPNSLEWMRAVFHDVSEADLRDILGHNAIRVYGLDRKWLEGIAAKIGHKPGDIIGNYKVDQRLISDFDFRSQFSKPSPQYENILDNTIDSDIRSLAA